jgi:hypothetical protein
MSTIDRMKKAVGPFYKNRPVHTFSDESLLDEINAARVLGIEKFLAECHDQINYAWKRKEIARVFEEEFSLDPMTVESTAIRVLQRESPEGWGDAAAMRHVRGYSVLRNEALDRNIYDQALVDGGWRDL